MKPVTAVLMMNGPSISGVRRKDKATLWKVLGSERACRLESGASICQSPVRAVKLSLHCSDRTWLNLSQARYDMNIAATECGKAARIDRCRAERHRDKKKSAPHEVTRTR